MHISLIVAACFAFLVLDFFVAREFYFAASMKGWASPKCLMTNPSTKVEIAIMTA